MTRVNTRSSQVREANERAQTEYVFEEPNQTQIPKEIERRSSKIHNTSLWGGFIDLKGKEDYQNIGRKQQQGWEFVTPEEVPEMGATSVEKERSLFRRNHRGDLALGKIPTFKLEAKKAHYLNKSKEMMDAVNQQLMGENNHTCK